MERRFIVDAMLGRLALWLRLTGNDALYSPQTDDDDLINTAQREDRILLTSDEDLYRRAERTGITAMLVRGNVDSEIAQVFAAFGIPARVDPNTARCSKCNGPLTHLKGPDKERVRNLVHEQTYNYYDEFWLCEDCGSVYFQGGYWRNITEYMDRIARMISEMDNQSRS
ncbi:MAG: Mut7-C RNAse domain-containing protein [Candidatus Thorarchaeota archaeon]